MGEARRVGHHLVPDLRLCRRLVERFLDVQMVDESLKLLGAATA